MIIYIQKKLRKRTTKLGFQETNEIEEQPKLQQQIKLDDVDFSSTFVSLVSQLPPDLREMPEQEIADILTYRDFCFICESLGIKVARNRTKVELVRIIAGSTNSIWKEIQQKSLMLLQEEERRNPGKLQIFKNHEEDDGTRKPFDPLLSQTIRNLFLKSPDNWDELLIHLQTVESERIQHIFRQFHPEFIENRPVANDRFFYFIFKWTNSKIM